MTVPRIDSHIHFWGAAELAAYEWMTEEMSAIRRPFGPEDLRPHLESHEIDGVVLVQTYASVAETKKYLELAGRLPFVAGVVGWVDLTDGDARGVLEGLRSGPDGRYLVGVRHQVHDEDDPRWLLRDDVGRGLAALAEAGLAYDVLVRTRELPAALQVCGWFPNLRFVIDHIAKPPIASAEIQPWAARMAPFAKLEHVSCKLSGMVTEGNWTQWTPEDLRPYAELVLEWFGENRLLFGSDWPVCTLAATYDEVVELAAQAVGGLDEDGRSKVFGGNAVEVYRLPGLL
jgi:L-fuconolactonase